jgi:hypothetical protein
MLYAKNICIHREECLSVVFTPEEVRNILAPHSQLALRF